MSYVVIKLSSGKTKRVELSPHVTPIMMSYMTEYTQKQMFGGVAKSRPLDRSIHGRIMSS